MVASAVTVLQQAAECWGGRTPARGGLGVLSQRKNKFLTSKGAMVHFSDYFLPLLTKSSSFDTGGKWVGRTGGSSGGPPPGKEIKFWPQMVHFHAFNQEQFISHWWQFFCHQWQITPGICHQLILVANAWWRIPTSRWRVFCHHATIGHPCHTQPTYKICTLVLQILLSLKVRVQNTVPCTCSSF